MAEQKKELFKIDASTIGMNPKTYQPTAMGTDGKSRYRAFGLATRVLYESKADGIIDLGLTVNEVRERFKLTRVVNQDRGRELELGIAVVTVGNHIMISYRDIGIWEKISDPVKTTSADMFRVLGNLRK